MRSLRIFYTDFACTSGQLVIASRESQYKILHFHHGGLERLADTLSHWKFLAQPLHEKVLMLERCYLMVCCMCVLAVYFLHGMK
jgi:hypothetical protein